MATPKQPGYVASSFVDSGFFVLRTPLLPFSEFTAWSEGLSARAAWESSATDSEALERAHEGDVKLLRARLGDILRRPEIIHALFVASPSLLTGLKYWEKDPDSKKGIQAERALVRYLVRMCSRSTPFGLFSGLSVGKILAEAPGPSAPVLRLRGVESCQVFTRLDFDYLFRVTRVLRADPSLENHLSFQANSSLQQVGGEWHYIESRMSPSGRTHHLVKVEGGEYVDLIIRTAERGATIPDLTRTLIAADEEISPDEAVGFLRELVANEVLVPTLTPLVTGSAALEELTEQIAAIPQCRPVAAVLRRARAGLGSLDDAGLGISPDRYSEIQTELAKLPVPFDPARLFQVDMVKPLDEAVLSKAVLDELLGSIAVVCGVTENMEPTGSMKGFRDTFTARYQQAQVPLLQVLNEETGIGFGGPLRDSSRLLRGLDFDEPGSGGGSRPQAVQPFLLRRLMDAIENGQAEVVLDPAETPPRGLQFVPDSFSVNATLSARSMEDVEKGDFQLYFISLLGPGAARLFGRFCHCSAELEEGVRHHLRQEEANHPDRIYAEIVHLPEGRIGNVLCRPVLRDYEIVYLGRSGADADKQIPLSDLLVSVKGSRTILFSKSLGKEVMPRLTNAHGFMNMKLTPVYRFLASLQHEEFVVPWFHWGSLESLDYLPRVRSGRVVLSKATWRIKGRESLELTREKGSRRFAAMQRVRDRRHMPRWIALEEGDNSLVVDLDNPLSVEAFLHVLKRTGTANVSELYPAPDQLVVTGPEGHFFHELNVPFVRRAPTRTAPPSPAAAQAAVPAQVPVDPASRYTTPGGEWCFFKIYGGSGTLDELLVQSLAPVMSELMDSQFVQRWFYVRYSDPDVHLRVRAQGQPGLLMQEAIPRIHAVLQEPLSLGKVWRVQLDTYDREIERYGGLRGMELSEDIFCADAEAAIEILTILQEDPDGDDRWRSILLSIDRLLSDFGLDLAQRLDLATRMRDAYRHEFNIGTIAKRELGKRYRTERKILQAMLDSSAQSELRQKMGPALERRSATLADTIPALRLLSEQGGLRVPLSEMISIHVHMLTNRMLRSAFRQHEAVLYDFLGRAYEGILALDKARVSGAVPA